MSPKSRYSVAGVILLLTGVRVLGKNYNLTIGPTMTIASDEMSAYALIDEYNAGNWLAKFDVLQISDPTHGYVNYVNQGQAEQQGLIRNQNNQIYMGVDTTSFLNPNGVGRNSVRLQSKNAYNRALVIGDFAHVPGSQCGTWPAFWMFGPNWPNSGEIDIMEGVHEENFNQMTLHTAPGCVPSTGGGGQSGYCIGNGDCGQDGGFVGCGVRSTNPTSFGTPFNANGGGVYAMLWTSSGIKVWYFAAKDVPGDIRSGNPNPNSWPQPQANFGGCDFNQYFRDMKIIFNITFCGDWAGAVWGQTACAQINPTCQGYVASRPQSFQESYWLVNSLKVYSV